MLQTPIGCADYALGPSGTQLGLGGPFPFHNLCVPLRRAYLCSLGLGSQCSLWIILCCVAVTRWSGCNTTQNTSLKTTYSETHSHGIARNILNKYKHKTVNLQLRVSAVVAQLLFYTTHPNGGCSNIFFTSVDINVSFISNKKYMAQRSMNEY